MAGFVHMIPHPGGRPPLFDSPSVLWDKFVEYCDYIDENPWQVKTASNALSSKGEENKGNSLRQEVRPMQRAYTLFGFCAFAGISSKWADFKRNYSVREGFQFVLDQIENVVCAQQVDGALINQFNGSIVARLNGLADKQQMELTGKDGEDFKFPSLTLDDIAELKKLNNL